LDGLQVPIHAGDRVAADPGSRLQRKLQTKLVGRRAHEHEDIRLGSSWGIVRATACPQGPAAAQRRPPSDGIDGVIQEDRSGLDVISVQAKRWKRERTVGPSFSEDTDAGGGLSVR
jgi:hypothetical protein